MGAMDSVVGSIKSSVAGMVSGFLGITAIIRVVDTLLSKLKEVQQIQNKIHEKSLISMEVGQAIALQTSTPGKQEYWAQKALEIQKTGGIKDMETVQGMMVQGDITFGSQGGISNAQNIELLKTIAPFVGAMKLGGAETSQLLQLAKTAQVKATPDDYKKYLSQLYSTYRKSDITNFGEFMTGAQSGLNTYMTMGGSFEAGQSLYSGALTASGGNQALAATLVKQAATLASGGREKPRKAMETALGVKWDELSMDQRTAALLQHIASIPELQRSQVLGTQGFEPAMATDISKLVSPAVRESMVATSQGISQAVPETIDYIGQDYITSYLGRSRISKSKGEEEQLRAWPKFRDWETRLTDAEYKFEALKGTGGDNVFIRDEVEPYVMAYEKMINDLGDLISTLPKNSETYTKAIRLRWKIKNAAGNLRSPFVLGFNRAQNQNLGPEFGLEFTELKQQTANFESDLSVPNQSHSMNITYNNNIEYHPAVGEFDVQRFSLDE